MDKASGQNVVATSFENPFPGLRPFDPKEAHLFFGREGQSEEILENLARNRFAAILGASGSGKSSLIYCGLLPILYGGFLHNDRSDWKVVITRPGTSPIENMAHAIASTFKTSSNQAEIESDALINQAILSRSSDGILNVLKQCSIAKNENILILVDQFEEIFRYQYSSKENDTLDKVEHFVNLLVNIVKQSEVPVYTVITMRSDFIGDCSPFQNLTRLINDSHYLIPRMTRDDFSKAVTGPVAVGGGKISDQLVQLLLNEMGNNPDHLPILQHALMRTWEFWVNHTDTSSPISIVEYEAIGRLERALSNHANEAYDELDLDQKRVCEVIFRSLTEKGADNRGIRRPSSVSELAAIAETSPQEVIKVVEVFRMKGRTFLTPPPHISLNESSIIDISHESLMRVWDKLKIWVEDESAAVKMYLRLAESADMYSEGKTSLWGPPDLQLGINWREKQKPTLAWAVRYHPAFERTMVYLKTSEEEYIAEEENKIRLQKRTLRRTRIFALILGTAGLVAIGLGILALIQRQDALRAGNEAIEQRNAAEEQRVEAERQKQLALENEKMALAEKERAEENQRQADEQRKLALANLNEADRQRVIATSKEREARAERERAVTNEKLALEQQRLAEQASLDAERRRMLSISQSMAVKSQQMRVDTLLKGLLAYQAYAFNSEYKGADYNPDIHKALYLSSKYFKGATHNVLTGHTSLLRSFESYQGKLYSSGSDGQLLSWDLNTKSSEIVQQNLAIVKKVVLQNQEVFGITNNGIFSYNKSTGTFDEKVYFPRDIKDFFINSSNKFILVFNQSVSIADSYNENPKEIFTSTTRINASKYIPSTQTLVLAMADGSIVTIKDTGEVQMPKQFVRIPDSNWGEMGYLPSKGILAAGFGNSQGTIYLWNMATGEQINVLRGHNAKITGIAFTNDGRYMASASYDGTVRLWNMADLNALPVVFDDHEIWVTAVTFTPDGKYIVSGDKNGNIMLFPVEIKTLMTDFCSYLPRELSKEEWSIYVGEDIKYAPKKCTN